MPVDGALFIEFMPKNRQWLVSVPAEAAQEMDCSRRVAAPAHPLVRLLEFRVRFRRSHLGPTWIVADFHTPTSPQPSPWQSDRLAIRQVLLVPK